MTITMSGRHAIALAIALVLTIALTFAVAQALNPPPAQSASDTGDVVRQLQKVNTNLKDPEQIHRLVGLRARPTQ